MCFSIHSKSKQGYYVLSLILINCEENNVWSEIIYVPREIRSLKSEFMQIIFVKLMNQPGLLI